MKSFINWLAAAASLIGLFFTLRPLGSDGNLSPIQLSVVILITVIFGIAALTEIRKERQRSGKKYRSTAQINSYMLKMLHNSGKCEICSRDASWIADEKILALLKDKATRGELTFLVHHSTPNLKSLAIMGAEVIEYGTLGFEPVTRFTVVNAGNPASSYVAIGRQKPNEPHIIEELDSSHPTYSMARDLIRSIRAAHDQSTKS
ncbi:hypothetical protein [Alcaligenes sp. SDU_A2]|uniref:hypothetical protein n=1 Tax=Alcaligenes sp. SDU_A2 TaxID=3136634 RepID=UPI00311D3B98